MKNKIKDCRECGGSGEIIYAETKEPMECCLCGGSGKENNGE